MGLVAKLDGMSLIKLETGSYIVKADTVSPFAANIKPNTEQEDNLGISFDANNFDSVIGESSQLYQTGTDTVKADLLAISDAYKMICFRLASGKISNDVKRVVQREIYFDIAKEQGGGFVTSLPNASKGTKLLATGSPPKKGNKRLLKKKKRTR